MKKRYLSRVLSLLLVLTMLAGFLIPAGAAGTESGTQGLEFEKTENVGSEMLAETAEGEEKEDAATHGQRRCPCIHRSGQGSCDGALRHGGHHRQHGRGLLPQ